MKQSTVTLAGVIAFTAVAAMLIAGVLAVKGAAANEQESVERRAELRQLGIDLGAASDFLTNEARAYAVTADDAHLRAYWNEIDNTKTRDKVVARLEELGTPQAELALIEEAKKNSDSLVTTESRAQRLVLEAKGTPESAMPPAIAGFELSPADARLGAQRKLATARRIMFDAKYASDKAVIVAPLARFQTQMNARAAAEAADATASRDRWTTVLLVLSVLAAVLMAAVLWIFHSQVGRVIGRYTGALATRDADDAEFALPVGGTAELRDLGERFNRQFAENREALDRNRSLLADMTALVDRVAEATASVSAASQQMASTSEEAGRAVGEIAGAVSEVASGAERQVRMITEARESSEETAKAAELARSVAEEGVSAADQASAAMHALRESTSDVTTAIRELAGKSEQIGGIVATITGIAGQTNLLALNAAIEAARAGEQGRGFAVVAEEVRKLAEESQHAAASIAELIGEIQEETERTVRVVEDGAERTEQSSATVEAARAAFQQIGASVEDMRGRIVQIVSATGEVSAVAEQSSASAEQVSASTEQTSASTQEIAASAQELARTAEQLEELVRQFKHAA
jgi:methyl-accepting chemotaxis protein